jgi:hypothetical protein
MLVADFGVHFLIASASLGDLAWSFYTNLLSDKYC